MKNIIREIFHKSSTHPVENATRLNVGAQYEIKPETNTRFNVCTNAFDSWIRRGKGRIDRVRLGKTEQSRMQKIILNYRE